jgi:putative transposase
LARVPRTHGHSCHKRRHEIAELLHALPYQHPRGTIYLACDTANTHENDEVEAGRLVPLYLPTYSPWLNPIERH